MQIVAFFRLHTYNYTRVLYMRYSNFACWVCSADSAQRVHENKMCAVKHRDLNCDPHLPSSQSNRPHELSPMIGAIKQRTDHTIRQNLVDETIHTPPSTTPFPKFPNKRIMKSPGQAFTPAPPRLTRRAALTTFAGFIANAAITPLHAEQKPKKGERGSKEAKGYQLCLSQCLYDCTTPKAAMAKERSQCRTECKDECAVSREQL